MFTDKIDKIYEVREFKVDQDKVTLYLGYIDNANYHRTITVSKDKLQFSTLQKKDKVFIERDKLNEIIGVIKVWN